jgi:diguanylate cyclase (GGDEF)-like protein
MTAPDATANILLVDDRVDNLDALEAVLEPLGQNLVRAPSGEEALRQLLNDEFALILLDVQMPGMDGFETAARIKQRARTRHIPIIFLTAISKDAGQAQRGYTMGAVDYLFKPFDPHVLRSKVAVFLDLHRLRREAEDLAHRALHDVLTGLPNRVLFTDRLELALGNLPRRKGMVAVTFIDLDGFKGVNDRHGHDMGDRALTAVARRLSAAVRPSDTVARMGGDEFTVLSEGLSGEAAAVEVAERLSATIAEPLELGDGLTASLGASFGIALTRDPNEAPEALIRRADAAMYRVKQRGADVPWLVDLDPTATG